MPVFAVTRLLIVAVLVWAIAACSSEPPPAADASSPVAVVRDDIVVPNAHLRIEGIPPVPKALAAGIGKYTDFRAVNVVAWHPDRRTMLVAYRSGATTQLHLLGGPLGALEPLTDFADPVGNGSFEPKHGAYLVYTRDTGGNEAAQLYRYDFATQQHTLLSDPSEKHGLGAWNHAGDALLMTSTQLDKTGKRDSVTTDLYALDPLHPEGKRKIASLPGGGWEEFRWQKGDRVLYALEYRSAAESIVWKIDVDDGVLTRVLPSMRTKRDAAHTVSYGSLHLTRDGKRLVYTSDEDGEFRQLMVMDLAKRTRRAVTKDIAWDVDAVVMHGEDGVDDGQARRELVCTIVNVAGRRELRVFDLDSGREVAMPALPAAARSGSVSRLRFARSGNRDEIAFTVNSAQSPGDVYTLDLRAGGSAKAEQWTRAVVEGVDPTPFREAEIVQWKSFDGRAISGLINRPPANFAGKRPVLVNIHGGPEGQSGIGFLGRNNYFVNELGIAYIQPNVRGSSGYGKTYLSLDDGYRRENSVKDIGALLDWIATQPDLDASRVMVGGGSYGGYMSLAVATMYADRIAASIDVVGISSFTTFLERTETYRRDLRRVEYGDERDPAMRAFFERISPLTNADRIRKPLFVVAGQNDPRVPVQEGEQIVAKVRGNGVPVWHLVADNEGHGFARKPNADYQFYAQVLFMQRYLLDPTSQGQ
jgi:dipeptidyl aminopeptidase/acylaminoacyl peptidase